MWLLSKDKAFVKRWQDAVPTNDWMIKGMELQLSHTIELLEERLRLATTHEQITFEVRKCLAEMKQEAL